MVVITHEMASIFTIGNNTVYLETLKQIMKDRGDSKQFLVETNDPALRRFLTRVDKS